MTNPSTPEPKERQDRIPRGLSAVEYAHGRYDRLRDAMFDVIARDTRYLREFNSRDPADPAIALIDSWAVAGDVLSFYAERIANESWLPTATERRSIRALARLIDYELRPGKAAEAWLAFGLETAPGAPLEVPIPKGTRAQSVPGPGETMVTFETVEALIGRPDLSAMRPRMTRPQSLDDVDAAKSALCEGVINDLHRGDWLLLVRSDRKLFRAERVISDPPSQTTRVDFTPQPVEHPVFLPLLAQFVPIVRSFIGARLGPSLMASEIKGVRRNQQALETGFHAARISPLQISRHLWVRAFAPPQPTAPQGLFRFRTRAAIFGHNVPDDSSPTKTVSTSPPTIAQACPSWTRSLALDSEYAELRPGTWIAFTRLTGEPFITKVQAVATASPRYGKLTGRVSRVTLESAFPSDWNSVSSSDVTVLADARPLTLATIPVTEPIAGSELRLDRYYPGLAEGAPIAVTGERADLPGVIENEVHKIRSVEIDDGRTVITLATAITGPFVRATAIANGNVVRATHGESGGQPIGHGDASAQGQVFRLPVMPLTHVGAPNAKGLAAELVIRVDGILWTEVSSLRDSGPHDRVYSLRYTDDGAVWVRFGDGVHGRRLPTGTNNVVAWWRKGLGREGMVRAGQLSLLSGAPQGVKAVSNPLPATGAADGENLEEARSNAPLSVLTLDRIVTLQDYEDFARAFGGIQKALAVWSWNGRSRVVAITVAGVAGDVPAESDLANLRSAIVNASDRAVSVTLLPYRPAWFRLEGSIRADRAYSPVQVAAAVDAALKSNFSFDKRQLGQPVARSEVISIIQDVPGVDWLDLDAFHRGETSALGDVLHAEMPRSGMRLGLGVQPIAAELLTLYPGATGLRVLS